MGKSTISTAIFNSYICMFTRPGILPSSSEFLCEEIQVFDICSSLISTDDSELRVSNLLPFGYVKIAIENGHL